MDSHLTPQSSKPNDKAHLFDKGEWLMCPPTYFDVKYEINPWMKVSHAPLGPRAKTQWHHLHHTLIRLGAWVEYVDPNPDFPDLVFTANAGLIRGKKVVLSRFRYTERQGEEPLFAKWFEGAGFEVIKLNSGSFEGEGDALYVGDTLFGGCGFRSDKVVYEEIAEILEVKRVVHCELVDSRFYHLDTCFAPLDSRQAMLFPGAFSPSSLKEIEKHAEIIAIPPSDAEKFACNAVVLGKDIVMPAGCDATMALLKQRGFNPYPVELDEFMKAGGAAKCLSLRLR